MQRVTPAPYFFPLPEPVTSPLDATYAKLDPSWPQWWLCRRCADYRPAGGIWKLQFDLGVMRIFYEVTGWRSFASFTLTDDELQVFNDPYCPEVLGRYRWDRVAGGIHLQPIDDPCAFGLRAGNLSLQTWLNCPSSDQVAESSQAPPGCAESLTIPTAEPIAVGSIVVSEHPGDAHHFARPPEIFAVANRAEGSSPAGIDVRFDPESIPFGINRVLWWDGEWIEATTDLEFAAIGVQFWGAPHTGWGRVMFDGAEVWRGIASALGSDQLQFGGYVELTGFAPGPHTIRVESLPAGYRPLTVAAFGFGQLPVLERAAP